MKELLQNLCNRLKNGNPAVTATIVYNDGSTPRGAGSKMLVDEKGLVCGTVGGGLSEALTLLSCQLACSATAQANTSPALLEFNLSGSLAAQSNMICGGHLRLLMEPLTPADLPVLEQALLSLNKEGGLMITRLEQNGAMHSMQFKNFNIPRNQLAQTGSLPSDDKNNCTEQSLPSHSLSSPSSPSPSSPAPSSPSPSSPAPSSQSSLSLSPSSSPSPSPSSSWEEFLNHKELLEENFAQALPHILSRQFITFPVLPNHLADNLSGLPSELKEFILTASQNSANLHAGIHIFDGTQFFIEPFIPPYRLIIAGGGHVSLPTARIAALTGFEVIVLDDRKEFADPARFPWAEKVCLIPDFENCFQEFPPSSHTGIIIVTRGHVHDSAVLAQALVTHAGYVGMIGSIRKREEVYKAMRQQGFADELARVHSPIGLAIHAETPEEIAVSIIAECIAWKRGNTPR